MTNIAEANRSTRFKVGVFMVGGLLLVGALSIFVNDKPFWWRPCQLVKINIDDATGLKTKSPIRSLGLEIGYLQSVELSETHVTLAICITAPVEVLPATRAYIRGEGFLGDKFVELKPVKYLGPHQTAQNPETTPSPVEISPSPDTSWFKFFESSASADEAVADDNPPQGREIPVGSESQDIQHLVNRVDSLVKEMTNLTTNLKRSINPEELHQTMRQLNTALQNASKTLSPQSGLNQTAQRTLSKLEDAVDQLRDQMTRINQGQGSLGKILNDPSYADELHQVLQNANRLLSKVGEIRFVVDINAQGLTAYSSGRGVFNLLIYPRPDRYYKIGIAANDPRGSITRITSYTTAGGQQTVTQTTNVNTTALVLTAMFGKIFFNNRLDLSVGVLYGDGTITAKFLLGPVGQEDRILLNNDLYSHSFDPTSTSSTSVNDRLYLQLKPYKGLYVQGGLESFNHTNGQIDFLYGGGITFDDDDIKLLFAFR